MIRKSGIAWLLPLLLLAGAIPTQPNTKVTGQFYRIYWYEKGLEHGNPYFNPRFRVNDPEVATNPRFMYRSEPRGNGMLQIRIEEDLAWLSGAELYLELWGGHPGTANKRVSINGRSQYPIPENGTAETNCTHLYPTLELRITDLVNGYNALQFACDKGSSFWGHFIVDEAALRLQLKNDHPDLKKYGLAGFEASVKATSSQESLELSLLCSDPTSIASVDYQGFYTGYDENGSGQSKSWHGFTKGRAPVAVAGHATEKPFTVHWDLSMLPSQPDVAVRALVHFKDHPELVYVTAPVKGIGISPRKSLKVVLHSSKELPKPFWSRAGRKHECSVVLDEDPVKIEQAELHVVVWDGGVGRVKDYFTLNGHALPVAGTGRHDVIYKSIREFFAKDPTNSDCCRIPSTTASKCFCQVLLSWCAGRSTTNELFGGVREIVGIASESVVRLDRSG